MTALLAHVVSTLERVRHAAQPLLGEIAHYPHSAGEDDDELVSVRLGDLRGLRWALARAADATAKPSKTGTEARSAEVLRDEQQ